MVNPKIHIEGNYKTFDVNALLGENLINKIFSHLKNHNEETIVTAIKETIKFLFLATLAPGSLFLAGDEIVDEVWHQIILETKIYKRLCEDLGSDFLHHSNITIDDYTTTKTSEEINQEYFSWLANYYFHFGEIKSCEFELLPLAKGIAKKLDINLDGLNSFARTLCKSLT